METKLRHFVKTITWRLCATTVAIIIVIMVTGDVKQGLIFGPIEFVIKSILYYMHERVWIKIDFGKKLQ